MNGREGGKVRYMYRYTPREGGDLWAWSTMQ